MRPLEGVRILDLTWLLAGGGGPRLLDALGAEVIRIEWRDRLDTLRLAPPFVGPEPDPNQPRDPGATAAQRQSRRHFQRQQSRQTRISLNMTHPKGGRYSSGWWRSAMWWSNPSPRRNDAQAGDWATR